MVERGKIVDSISCTSSTFCVAVDNSGNSLTYSGSWGAVTNRDSHTVNSVSCPTTSFCTAVDNNGDAFVLDPESYSRPTGVDIYGSTALISVSGTSPSFCVAVDGERQRSRLRAIDLHANNGSSAVEDVDGTRTLRLSCVSSTDRLAFDNNG